MEQVPSSEFTKAPARHLEAVFKGATLLLTRYGRPYVVLSPPPAETEEKEKKPARSR